MMPVSPRKRADRPGALPPDPRDISEQKKCLVNLSGTRMRRGTGGDADGRNRRRPPRPDRVEGVDPCFFCFEISPPEAKKILAHRIGYA